MTKFGKILVLGIVVIIIIIGVFPYDTDESYNAVMKKYGYDIGERTRTFLCKDDGVGVRLVPFGTISYYCSTSWFVLFNKFPFEIKGEETLIVPESNNSAIKELNIQEVKDMISSSSLDKNEMQEWKSYTSERLGISFKYPPDYLIMEMEEIRIFEDTSFNRQYAKTINPEFDYEISEKQKNTDIEPGQGISLSKRVDGGFTQDIAQWFEEENIKIGDRIVYGSANFIGMDAVAYRAEGLFMFDGVFFEKEESLYQFSVQYFNSPESPRGNFYKIISTVEF